MLDLERVKGDERLLRAVTGLNLKALETLTPSFAQALAEAPIPRRRNQPRERAVGGGRKPRLASVEDKLLDILFYFKCYPTFDLVGLLFDLDRSAGKPVDASVAAGSGSRVGSAIGTPEAEAAQHG